MPYGAMSIQTNSKRAPWRAKYSLVSSQEVVPSLKFTAAYPRWELGCWSVMPGPARHA